MSLANRMPPRDLQLAFPWRHFFRRRAVTVRTQPLRPVGARRRRHYQQHNHHDASSLHSDPQGLQCKTPLLGPQNDLEGPVVISSTTAFTHEPCGSQQASKGDYRVPAWRVTANVSAWSSLSRCRIRPRKRCNGPYSHSIPCSSATVFSFRKYLSVISAIFSLYVGSQKYTLQPSGRGSRAVQRLSFWNGQKSAVTVLSSY